MNIAGPLAVLLWSTWFLLHMVGAATVWYLFIRPLAGSPISRHEMKYPLLEGFLALCKGQFGKAVALMGSRLILLGAAAMMLAECMLYNHFFG